MSSERSVRATRLHLDSHVPVPVVRSRAGQPHVALLLNGRPVSALIDTGAAHTVVDRGVAAQLGLAIVELAVRFGGAGAASVDAYQVDGAELRVGAVGLRTALLAADFGPINFARARHRDRRVDVVVGVDVFAAHDAVIDCGADVVYLRM
jgi:hypothetical protein